MKKTYIQPSIQEVKIQATTILAGSSTDPVTGAKFNSEAPAVTTSNGMDSFKGGMGFVEITDED